MVFSQEEVEGELVELVMGFLGSRKVLLLFVVVLIYEVVLQFLQIDFFEFRKLFREEEEEEEEDDEEEGKVFVILLDV